MGKKKVVFLSLFLLSLLLLQGCLFDVTSILGPTSTTTGKVVTFTITGTSVSSGTNSGGVVLQIPNGTSVLRVHYQYQSQTFPPFGNGSGFLIETPTITSGYTAESGYHLYGGVANASNDGSSTITCKVWLSVPDGVTAGIYSVKAAVGGYASSVWVPQNPQANGTQVMDFSQISGRYASAPFSISAGTADTIAPADVTPVISGDFTSHTFTFNISAYDETAQGDIAKYRVYVSKSSFDSTAGGQLLNDTTVPSAAGSNINNVSFSSDIGTGLFYFEVPPGSEFPLTVHGLASNDYFFAATAVDVSGNESNPIVAELAVGAISGTVTDGINPITNASVTVYDVNCRYSAGGSTDINGNYTVAPLLTGSYNVSFSAPGYLSQWYNQKQSCPAADTVSVTVPTATTVDAALSSGGSITGTVTDGTNPIAGASVQVYDVNCNYLSSGVTDTSGNYAIGTLPAGYYNVMFSAPNYFSQWYSQKQSCPAADTVSVTVPNATTVNAVLLQGGSITGTVTDGTNPIAGVSVQVYDVNCYYFSSGYTDANGNYTVSLLPTGSYNVEFYNYNYVTQWYNGKQNCPTADNVSVTAPTATTVNAVLSQRGKIKGTVTDGASPIATGVLVQVYDSNCQYKGYSNTDSNGNYTVPLLPTGNYKVSFSAYNYLTQWFNGKTDCASADVVAVTEPNATTVNAVLAPSHSLFVYNSGTGAGTVTGSVPGSPSGINCGNSCSQNVLVGAQVDLSAWPSAGSIFDGWAGDCTGNTNPCTVTMSTDRSVTATFTSIADFTGVPTFGYAPFFVTFIDKSKNTPTAWIWSFGDGATDTRQNPVHNYASSGTYAVSLVAETAGGFNTITKPYYISVGYCGNQPARTGTINHYPYPTIQSAYDAAADGDYVDAHAKDFFENLNFAHNVAVTFRGGFNCEFATHAGQFTTLHGTLTISGKTVTIENFVIE